MTMSSKKKLTACLVLADGSVFYGHGFGATGIAVAELCFNTSITGYQEIMTDPSYVNQIITFTFPHIGNTGITADDNEALSPHASGMVVKWDPTNPSNWRAQNHLSLWLESHNRIAIGGIDTRRLTQIIRKNGAPHVAICHNPEGIFNVEDLVKKARAFKGLKGTDLATEVSCKKSYTWSEKKWNWPEGYRNETAPKYKVVAIDYGAKHNILRCLASVGCDVTVVPSNASVKSILALKPDGIFLSNGPGDPAATGAYAVPIIKSLLTQSALPVFGICLGHQMLALALGGKTVKMNHGHHGANHPVKDLENNKVEITSMNHGFAVDGHSLPFNVIETHISLFDGSNCGIRLKDRAVFSVQYHPEASPGPQDSFYLFEKFASAMESVKSV